MQIGQDKLQYSGFEGLFILKYKKSYVQYQIKSYPDILFVLFDLDYNELINNKNKIITYINIIYILKKISITN